MRLRGFKVHPAAIVSPIAFLLQLVTNYCSVYATGNKLFPSSLFDVGNKYKTRMWPEVSAFPIIWGVIYFFQFLYVGRQFLTAEHRKDTNILFPITCALNITWVFCFVHEKMVASLAVFGALWLTLAALWVRLKTVAPPARTLLNYLSLTAPFSLYLGWATFDIQLNATTVVQMYRGSPFNLSEIIITTLVALIVGWIALAVTCDLMLAAGILYGFSAVLYRAHAAKDNELLFVMGLAISSLGSAAAVRLATNWLKKDGRFAKQEASSLPLEPRLIEA